MIFKTKEIEVNISSKAIDIGDIGAKFYTEDDETGALKFLIKHKNIPYNFLNSKYKPYISLYLEDGSIFTLQEMTIINPEKGLVQYELKDNIVKHAGKVNAKLFLYGETELDGSTHILNFSFNIISSGEDELIEKEIDLNSISLQVSKEIQKQIENINIVNGKSAYELAVENGYTGTVVEWLDSLKNSGSLNTQEIMTYEKAVDLGLNPEWYSKELFDEVANKNKEELVKDFNLMALYGNPSYTYDDFIYGTTKNLETMLIDSNKYLPTIGYGQLPTVLNGNTPQDYIDWQNKIALENGSYNGNFIEYLYYKISNMSSSNSSPLKNLNFTIIGDSITEINFRSSKTYHQFISERTGAIFNNLGYSGTGFSSRPNVANEIHETPDGIIIFLGTNDWAQISNSLPLGTIDSRGYENISGQIFNMLNSLVSKFPYTPIMLITPLPRIESNPYNNTKNDVGYSLGELSDIIIEYGKMFGIPVLDLYRESNLRPWIDANNKKFFAYQDGAEDGLHPNTNGHEYISYQIQSFLEDKGIVGTKHEYVIPNIPSTELGDGRYEAYLTPENIFWDTKTSFAMNIAPKDNFDISNVIVESIELNGITIDNPQQIEPKLLYWYTLPDNPDGTEYNNTSKVTPLHETLIISSFDGERYDYIPEQLKVIYRLKV